MIFSLYIINKAGGLIYQRNFTEPEKGGLAKLSSNDYLVLAGTFHGVHAITAQISPLPHSSGIESLETENFRIQCFQTRTGTKFLLFTEPRQPNSESVARRVYELYTDYVMKNPFYQVEMPVRCEMFDRHLAAYLSSV
ncbi:Sybindin-like protein [Saitoella complicata NRRL Y-17804]|uniref:Sybindin-like protein n=1 Tax=Saitoella complicata (strain BCRC 22490 / CBS 7301 / JCM 7358 / NBRC 10748 / NRRL Y-17804) TaxID=698492 RepID=UPI00086731B2|nr:Sybindin-like protein [Saitoella complicata NRRL Y-17804]ODQ52646.1 Sybindin-like protein [Saitoella complicata NRRL Y-17804]